MKITEDQARAHLKGLVAELLLEVLDEQGKATAPTTNAADDAKYDTLPDGDHDQPTTNAERRSSNGRKLPAASVSADNYDTLPE